MAGGKLSQILMNKSIKKFFHPCGNLHTSNEVRIQGPLAGVGILLFLGCSKSMEEIQEILFERTDLSRDTHRSRIVGLMGRNH